MKYLSLLIIVLLTISSVLSQDVYCEIDYTIPWSSQGCKSTSDYTSTCSSMYYCLDFTANLTQKLQNVENTYIILKTDNYDTIDDCVGVPNGFPTSVNVIFETTMDYVNIQCKQQQMFFYLVVDYHVNLYFNNMHFNDLVSQNSPITIYYMPSQFDGVPSNLYFSNIIVTNSESSSGGFLITDRYNVKIINSIFTNCKASYGGAIFSAGSNTTVSIIDSSFTGCYAYNYAGVIFGSNYIFTQNSTFSKNGCGGYMGGALYANIVNVVNSTFESNFITNGGGGAIGSLKSIYINDSLFFENNASSGGAVSSFDVYVEKSTFINNRAVDVGGAISTTNLFTIIGSNFESNTANSGGAVEFSGSGSGSIEKSTFYKNTAVKNGGAIYVYSPFVIGAFSLWDSSFTSNNAQYGGAIYAKGIVAFDLSNSLFLYNYAIYEAGSIYFNDPQKSNKIVGGTFVNSTSIGAAQTFNNDLIKSFGSVYVSSSLVNPGSPVYSVPLVFDVNTAPYAKAYETNANECSNGVATIDLNGDVTGCTCFTGYTGPHCT